MTFEHPKQLRFHCDRCALCCGDTKNRARTILLLKAEANRIRSRTGRNLDEFADRVEDVEPYVYRMKKSKEGKCLFLNGNSCAVYDIRPLVCRFYPFELKDSGSDKYVFICTQECLCVGTGPLLRKRSFEKLFETFMDAMSRDARNR